MNHRWPPVLSLAFCLGCGAHPAPATTTTPASTPVRAHTEFEHSIARVERALGGSGLSRAVDLGNGYVAEGQGVTLPLTIPAHGCAVLTAVASGALADLDATLYEASGRELTSDREPDAHPTVAACADATPLRAYYRLDAYRGVGAYTIVRYAGPPSALVGLGERLGGEPGVLTELVEPSALDEAVAGAEARAFVLRAAPRSVHLTPGSPLRLPLPVEAGTCVAVVAMPHPPLTAALLFIRDEGDVVRAEDRSQTSTARAQACAREDADWTIEIQATGGDVEVAVLDARQSRIGAETALFWGVRPDRVGPEPSGEMLAHGQLLPGEVAVARVPIHPGRCANFAAVGDASVGALQLRGLTGDTQAGSTAAELRICRAVGSQTPEVAVSARGAGSYRLLRISAEER